MGVNINNIQFKQTDSLFVIFKSKVLECFTNGKLYFIYSKGKNIIDFLNNKTIYQDIIQSDFNKISVISFDEDTYEKNFSYEYLIEYFRNRLTEGHNNYSTYRVLFPQDINGFYKFEVWIEIAGVRIAPGTFDQNQEYPGCILLPRMEEKLKKSIPYKKVPTPMDGRGEDYLISDSYIDKIIGVKRFKDINWIGTGWEHYDDFTSETEEYVLDLHHFDQDIYRIFKEHNALEILR